MKLPVYLDILWHINYWLELIVPVIFLLFYKQLPKTKFVKAFVIYLLLFFTLNVKTSGLE